MPNWCNCTYKCVGELKEVKSLHKNLKYIDKRKTSILKNGFGKWWLGNLVTKLGGDWEKYRCRGEITGYELNDNVLTIEVHSIVSASRFFHMPTYLRVVIECQSRFFPFFPAFSRNCPDYFLHTSGSSSFRSLSDLGAR